MKSKHHAHQTSLSRFVNLLIAIILLECKNHHACICFSFNSNRFLQARCRSFMTTVKSNEGSSDTDSMKDEKTKKDNKAMEFLRKIGRVSNKYDFTNAIGVDEGIASKETATFRKSASAYRECTEGDGIIDDMTEKFPFTSSGNQWYGLTDTSFGGNSSGSLTRENYKGKTANVLRGVVTEASNKKLENECFIQMATNLALDKSSFSTVDASKYSGIKLVAFYDGSKDLEKFNIHFRTPACRAQLSCYRAPFELEKGAWETIQVPWDDFIGIGPGPSQTKFDKSALKRLSIVALGEKPDFTIAVSQVGFY